MAGPRCDARVTAMASLDVESPKPAAFAERPCNMTQGAGEPGRFGVYSERVIGACIEVHRVLGPGLLESAYEECLAHELTLRGLRFDRQMPLPVNYKGIQVEFAYRLDFVVEDEIVLEIKAVHQLLPVHEAQVITYLKLTQFPIGLLVNFHSTTIKAGLRRLTRRRPNPPRLPTSL